MTSIVDRIEEIRKSALPGRLKIGAGHLGRLWKEGLRCKSGWRSTCSCGLDQTVFCRTKLKWIDVLRELRGGYPYGLAGTEEYFVIEAMTLSMVEASGLTVLVEVPGARKPVKLGGLPETWNLLPELAAMDEDSRPGFLEVVMLVQEAA
jgi:hypothetical protein